MRKYKLIISAVCAVLLLAVWGIIQFGPFPLSSDFLLSSYTTSEQTFIAHRGFSYIYPENTIPAIEGAIEKGYYGCEFDIHSTKDGIWILNHDTSIDNMTDGSGEINDFTYEEILAFNVDSGKGIENYKNLKLPTLREALSVLSESEVIPFIEIKGYDPVAFETLLGIIDSFNLSDRAVIISFDMDALLGLRSMNKDIALMYLTNDLTIENVDICIENNMGVNINGGLIFKMTDAVKYAQKNNLDVAAWTIDFPLFADVMNIFDIKYITTNRITP